MIILGVDPGTATMGYGILEKSGNRFRALAYGALETPKTMRPHERLHELYHGLRGLCETYQPDALATEQLLFQTNRRTAIAVARAAGGALRVGAGRGVAGRGGADKKQVQTMVQRLLGLESVPKPNDAADALAIAICHAHHAALNQRVQP